MMVTLGETLQSHRLTATHYELQNASTLHRAWTPVVREPAPSDQLCLWSMTCAPQARAERCESRLGPGSDD